MKSLLFGKLKKCLVLVILMCFINLFTVNAQTVCNNGVDTHDGYTYEYWKDQGNGCMVLGPGGSFSIDWSNINNLLARKGVRPGSWDNIVSYEAEYRPNGNSYLCVYGWTTDPLIEYYIIDSWGTWRPPGGEGFRGTVTSDGSTYDIYRTQRFGQMNHYQFWSVRQLKRAGGNITVGNHFRAWENLGMNMGSLYEVSFCVEGYQSSGTADVYSMSISTVPPVPQPTPTPTLKPAKKLGDVDGDGTIDITDALMIARYSVGLTPPGFGAEMADTNCDGIINIIDALIIAQYTVGLLPDFTATCAPGLTLVGSLKSNVGTRYGWQATSRKGDIVFTAGKSKKMQIFDVGAGPQFIKEIDIGAVNVFDMIIRGNNLYLKNDGWQLSFSIYDITDPRNPVFRRRSSFQGSTGLAFSGHYAYAGFDEEFVVYNLSDPTRISNVGKITLDAGFSINKIYIQDDFAYLPRNNRLIILDISNPEAPVVKSNTFMSELRESKMVIRGDYAFCNGDDQLYVLNIADPLAPVLELIENIGITATKLTMTERNTLILSNSSNLYVINVSDPLAPMIKGSDVLPEKVHDLSYAEGILHVVYSDTAHYSHPDAPFGSVLELFDVSDSDELTSMFSINGSGYSSGILVEPPYAYLIDSKEGLKIIDISDPAFPGQIGSIKTTDARNLVISGDIAYLADGPGGVKAIDISNPRAPALIDSVMLDDVQDITTKGSYAYVADNPGGVSIVDISNPTHLRVIYKAVNTGTAAAGLRNPNLLKITISGNYTFMIQRSSPKLLIHDISDPHAPLLTAEHSFSNNLIPSAGDILLKDNLVYVSSCYDGLNILDISEPAEPRLLGTDSQSCLYKMSLYNDHILGIGESSTSSLANEVFVTDVTDPATPFLAGHSNPGDIPTGIVVNDGYAYLSCNNAGPDLLRIYKIE